MRSFLHSVAAWAAPHRQALAWAALLMLLESAAALAVPWLAGKVAGGLTGSSLGAFATQLQGLLSALLALFALQAVLRFATRYQLVRTGQHITTTLKNQLYEHLQALPMAYFHARRQGDALALITRDAEQISHYISGTVVAVVPLLFTVLGAAAIMFHLHPLLALLAVLLVPCFVLLFRLWGRRMRPLAQQTSDEYVAWYALVEENLGLVSAIKTFTREPLEATRHQLQTARIRQLNERYARIESALGPGVQFLAAAGILVVLWGASGALGTPPMGAAELVSFLLYAQLLTRPVPGLADTYGQTQVTRAAVQRLADVLAEPAEAYEAGTPLPALRGAVRFEGVSFAYPGRAQALNAVNIEVAAGETVAFVGPNGAGKSTLVNLLLRLYAPAAGCIRLDGHDIAGATLPSLRRQIGVVPQHPQLFNASVFDNIALGLAGATPAQVQAAAVLASAHAFIAALPQGYGTLIGDDGVRLSGGQQQRIALARALLKNPAILVLDEATSMFDPEAELEFLAIARQALKGKTVLLITHRPASLAVADRVLRVDNGQVVPQGRP